MDKKLSCNFHCFHSWGKSKSSSYCLHRNPYFCNLRNNQQFAAQQGWSSCLDWPWSIVLQSLRCKQTHSMNRTILNGIKLGSRFNLLNRKCTLTFHSSNQRWRCFAVIKGSWQSDCGALLTWSLWSSSFWNFVSQTLLIIFFAQTSQVVDAWIVSSWVSVVFFYVFEVIKIAQASSSFSRIVVESFVVFCLF